MLESGEGQKPLISELKEELHSFEVFLKSIGFKRIHGSIYGLLVISNSPLTSAQIEKELGISQSAISHGLKVLTQYNAISSRPSDLEGQKNTLVHTASVNTLNIVASVLRKREAEYLDNYKQMAKRLQRNMIDKGESTQSLRMQRIDSILTTCQLGTSIIDFILLLSEIKLNEKLKKITKRLPQVLNLLTESTPHKKTIFAP